MRVAGNRFENGYNLRQRKHACTEPASPLGTVEAGFVIGNRGLPMADPAGRTLDDSRCR